MPDSLSGSDLLNELAHDFAERYRRGERPALNDYTDRYPDLAGEIRELFPTLVMMEQFGSGVDNPPDPSARRGQCEQAMPELLGDYRILREVGRGGMGIVYEAVQESLGRHVALKVLSQFRQFGTVQLLRFEREAKAAALLHHTNIVPVFGVGQHEGVHYYAMQYIEGQSLDTVFAEIIKIRERSGRSLQREGSEPEIMSASLAEGLFNHRLPHLRTPTDMRQSAVSPSGPPTQSAEKQDSRERGRSPVSGSSTTTRILGSSEAHYFRSVARLGMQAAEALGYAHLHGVVHRDIKPANLLLDLRGTLWVTDFGLAKAEGSHELTSPGDIVGTLRYMAPERFKGKADARSDIYSLGLTLYEMLSFAPAFTASHRVEYINAILHVEPRRPRSLDPRIPIDLETIVLRAISKNPADRFATADEMARELGRFVEGRPILSRRVSVYERVWRWSRRNRMTAALIVLAASLTSILAVGSTVAAWMYREQRDQTRASLDRATEAERERKTELGRSYLVQARALRYSGQPGRRTKALATLEKSAHIAHAVKAPRNQLAELRDEVIAALALPNDHQVEVWSDIPYAGDLRAFSVAGDRFVDVGPEGLIHVHRLSDKSELRVLGADRLVRRFWPAFVPGGRFVHIVADSKWAELWDLERGVQPEAWPRDARGAAVRSDGSQVAALRSTGELVVFDLPSFNRRSSCRLGFDVSKFIVSTSLCLSQTGHQLALIRPDAKLACVVDVASGRVVREIKMPTSRVGESLALSGSGGLLAIAHDRAISVFDMADGEQLSLLQAHQSEGIVARFQLGGDLLASSSWDGTTRLWDPIRGRLLVTLDGDFREWGDGGSSLIIGRGHELTRHQIARGTERRTIDCRMLGDRAGAVLYGPARVAYSPDGRLLAMAVRPEGVRIARLSDGVGLALLPIGYCDEVLFMPDGDVLTFNDLGLCRWPVQTNDGTVLRVGPPEPLAMVAKEPNWTQIGLAVSADGRIVGCSSFQQRGSLILDPDHPWRRKLLFPQVNVFDLAISGDGRWACTASRAEGPNVRQVMVWEISTGKILKEFSQGVARVAFSPDSRWLGVGGKAAYRFYRTGTWTEGPVIEYGTDDAVMALAFHPGSRVAALLDSSRSFVKIADVETGEILARLDVGDKSTVYHMVFSPDGRNLAVSKSDQRVDLWDLSSIRRRLEQLGLADGIPDIFDEGAPAPTAAPIDHIDVRGADRPGLRMLAASHVLSRGWFNFQLLFEGDLAHPEDLELRGDCWNRLGQWRLAMADYRALVARRPDSAMAANELAWMLASAPGRGDALEALTLARKAVQRVPQSPAYQNTLGAALYRAGRFAEAASVLERNIPQNVNDFGLDLIFLAMCKQRLGQPAAARDAFARARQWRAKSSRMSPWYADEFKSLVDEFESLPKPSLLDLPADVFVR